MKNNRIWELDAFRGLCILGVIIVHTIYDLQMFNFIQSETPFLFNIIRDYGGLLFVILSGICVTLGHHSFKRGVIVFLCGMIITLVTFGMYKFDFAYESIMIHFGVLHLLGICMIIYPIYKRLPNILICIIGIGIILLGIVFEPLRSNTFLTVPFGIIPTGYSASDYFPLVPNLGWFMIGVFLGHTIYKKKTTLFPSISTDVFPIKALSFCGRHSLWIYMGHQPIIYAIVFALYTFVSKS